MYFFIRIHFTSCVCTSHSAFFLNENYLKRMEATTIEAGHGSNSGDVDVFVSTLKLLYLNYCIYERRINAKRPTTMLLFIDEMNIRHLFLHGIKFLFRTFISHVD